MKVYITMFFDGVCFHVKDVYTTFADAQENVKKDGIILQKVIRGMP